MSWGTVADTLNLWDVINRATQSISEATQANKEWEQLPQKVATIQHYQNKATEQKAQIQNEQQYSQEVFNTSVNNLDENLKKSYY